MAAPKPTPAETYAASKSTIRAGEHEALQAVAKVRERAKMAEAVFADRSAELKQAEADAKAALVEQIASLSPVSRMLYEVRLARQSGDELRGVDEQCAQYETLVEYLADGDPKPALVASFSRYRKRPIGRFGESGNLTAYHFDTGRVAPMLHANNQPKVNQIGFSPTPTNELSLMLTNATVLFSNVEHDGQYFQLSQYHEEKVNFQPKPIISADRNKPSYDLIGDIYYGEEGRIKQFPEHYSHHMVDRQTMYIGATAIGAHLDYWTQPSYISDNWVHDSALQDRLKVVVEQLLV